MLRDWKIRVVGKAAALAAYGRTGGAAAELAILIDGRDTLYVVDAFDFDADGRIAAIRAYIGRGDEDAVKA